MIILVMDDDRTLKSLTASALRRKGHIVHEAESATWAIHTLTSHPEIEAAVIDIMAAGANVGVPTAQHIRRLNPKVKIVLVSGMMSPTNDFFFLPKPYEIDDIVNLFASMGR